MKVLRFEIPKFDNYQAFRTLYNIYHPLYKSTVAKTVSLYKFLHLVNSKQVPTFGQSIKISTFQPLLESRLKFVISSPQLKRNSPKTFEAITVQILPTLPFTTLLQPNNFNQQLVAFEQRPSRAYEYSIRFGVQNRAD